MGKEELFNTWISANKDMGLLGLACIKRFQKLLKILWKLYDFSGARRLNCEQIMQIKDI